jgi:hypothetical protein
MTVAKKHVKTYRFKQLQEAVQWTGNMEAVIELLGHGLPTYGEGKDGSLRLGDDIEIAPGWWIVRTRPGGTYTVSPQ